MTWWRSRVVRWVGELVVAVWLGVLTTLVVLHVLEAPPLAPVPVVACAK